MSDEKQTPRVASAAEIKRRKFLYVETGDGLVFQIKRVDLVSMFMEGTIPLPLMHAVDHVNNMRQRINFGGASALEELKNEDRDAMKEAVRRIAVLVSVKPKLTHSKKEAQDGDALWVGGESDIPDDTDNTPDVLFRDLMDIWKAVMGEAGVKLITLPEAVEFRESEPQSPADAVRDGDHVSGEAERLDLAAGVAAAEGPDSEVVREWKSYH